MTGRKPLTVDDVDVCVCYTFHVVVAKAFFPVWRVFFPWIT